MDLRTGSKVSMCRKVRGLGKPQHTRHSLNPHVPAEFLVKSEFTRVFGHLIGFKQTKSNETQVGNDASYI